MAEHEDYVAQNGTTDPKFGIEFEPIEIAPELIEELIERLAPLTRRDEWWATQGPREIIGTFLAEKLKNYA